LHRKAAEVIIARGHANILATHRSTFEITKQSDVTRSGDCVVAVSANKAISDFGEEFKKVLHSVNAKLTLLFQAEGISEMVKAYGSPRLILTHSSDTVLRKSSYVCARTLAVKADKAACDLSRRLVEKLRDPRQQVTITLTVEV
jgi:hypothetical protein